MKQRFQNVAPAPLWKDSPSYPGAPELPIVKQSTAKGATYETVVIHPAGIGARYGGCVGIGIGVWVSTRLVTAEWVIVALIAVGLVFTLYGGVGLLLLLRGDRNWYTYAPGVSMTLMQPERTEAQPAPARPFVASENGKRTRTGRLQFAPAVWQSLFDMALQNGGTVTKDIARGAGVGRQWYHTDYATTPDGFRPFLNELRQLGFIDAQNGLTAAALEWYAAQFPALPLAAAGLRPGTVRPTRGSDATDPAEDGAGGYE